jgi:hypothetical protein
MCFNWVKGLLGLEMFLEDIPQLILTILVLKAKNGGAWSPVAVFNATTSAFNFAFNILDMLMPLEEEHIENEKKQLGNKDNNSNGNTDNRKQQHTNSGYDNANNNPYYRASYNNKKGRKNKRDVIEMERFRNSLRYGNSNEYDQRHDSRNKNYYYKGEKLVPSFSHQELRVRQTYSQDEEVYHYDSNRSSSTLTSSSNEISLVQVK